ncbi:MAG: 3-hydroxyacyl-CoA dehydrogenase/enoyl-CoA hydratase family protein [Thermoleophilia bacterium]
MTSATAVEGTYQNPLLVTPERGLPRHVAIVGAGTIGPDIGYYLKAALPDITLTLVDVAEAPLEAARERYSSYAEKGVKRGKLKREMVAPILANITYSTEYGALEGADLVIEAATENIALKKQIFAQIEGRVSPEAIITSNTSSIPAQVIFADVERPERTTVTHFFAPAWRNPAVEVIEWEGCSRDVLNYLRWLFAITGKVPLVTADVACFMLDRIFDNWCNEAAFCLDFATAKQVDKVAEEFAAAGPFWVVDMSNGNPIIVETNGRQMEAEGACYKPAAIWESVLRWVVAKKGEKVQMEPHIRDAVKTRLLGILYGQSLDIVARGIGTASDLELGCELALGFKKGPLTMMRESGVDTVEKELRAFERERPGFPGLNYVDRLDQLLAFKKYIVVDRLDDVVVITLRRPAQLNALTDKVNEEILEVLKEHESDGSVRGFVLVGYGPRAFCAGAEIGYFATMLGDEEASTQYARDSSQLLEYIDRMTKPIVAAVNGLALGGGAELAMRCHEMVCSPRAYFQLPEINLGVLPGIGGMVIPYRKWPQAAGIFTDMSTKAERLSAERAFELGIVSALASTPDTEELVKLAADRVRSFSRVLPVDLDAPPSIPAEALLRPDVATQDGPSRSVEIVDIIMQAVEQALQAQTLADALEVGYQAFGRAATTPAAAEGVHAFLDGRAPDFTGM